MDCQCPEEPQKNDIYLLSIEFNCSTYSANQLEDKYVDNFDGNKIFSMVVSSKMCFDS